MVIMVIMDEGRVSWRNGQVDNFRSSRFDFFRISLVPRDSCMSMYLNVVLSTLTSVEPDTRVWKMERRWRCSAFAERLHHHRNTTYCMCLTTRLSGAHSAHSFFFYSRPQLWIWRSSHWHTGSRERVRIVSVKARTSSRWCLSARAGHASGQEAQE
jgi:hypothetical protein